MLFKSPVYSQASGSIAGIVYSHNRGGLYTRARSVPVNPNTVQQQAVRNAMLTLSTRWQGVLTSAQRTEWETYAINVPLVGPTGDTRNVGGIGMYNRSNVVRVQSGLSVIDPGPVVMSLPTFTIPTLTVAAATDLITVTFTNTDGWAGEVGGAMLVYASRPQSPTINFFKGPYRYAGRINGAVSPPTSPATIALPFPVTVGNRIFLKVEVVRADGRLSSPFRTGVNAT
jgi:hypothetical protein